MAEGVRLKTLVSELQKSRLPASAQSDAGPYPFFVSSPSVRRIDHAFATEPSVILGTGGVASVHLALGSYAYSTDTWAIRPSGSDLEVSFLYYLLDHFRDIIDRRGFEGSGLRHLQKNFVRNLRVDLPSHEIQQTAVGTLRAVDDAIRHTESVIAKLQQMREGYLHDLLTRGIDEHGKLRDPARHPEQFKDSPIGQIPRSWDVRPLPHLTQYQNGAPFPSSDYGASGVPLLRPGNLQASDFVVWDKDHTTYLPRKWERIARDFIVGPNEVVMNLTAQSLDDGFLARVCVTPQGTRCLLNQRIARFRVHGCDPMYFFWACKSSPFRSQIDRLCQGTKVQHIYNRNLDSLLVQVPADKTEQSAIAATLFGHGDRVREERLTLDKLRSLKRGLMDDLLTGRVRVTVSQEAIA